MSYVSVFELSQKPFQWWAATPGLMLLLVGILLVKITPMWPERRLFRLGGWSLTIFSLLWIAQIMIPLYSNYRECENALKSQQSLVVEGVVADFHPMPYEGHQNESFRVKNVTFEYSDFSIQNGFNHSASHGGPIREGLPVRITYYRGNILRLEIKANGVQNR